MEIAINRRRKHASLRVSDDVWDHKEFERYVIHELLHLVFDPISEQHEFVVSLWQAISNNTQKLLLEKHLDEVEKAVEHMSYVLYHSSNV